MDNFCKQSVFESNQSENSDESLSEEISDLILAQLLQDELGIDNLKDLFNRKKAIKQEKEQAISKVEVQVTSDLKYDIEESISCE